MLSLSSLFDHFIDKIYLVKFHKQYHIAQNFSGENFGKTNVILQYFYKVANISYCCQNSKTIDVLKFLPRHNFMLYGIHKFIYAGTMVTHVLHAELDKNYFNIFTRVQRVC